MTNGSAFSLLLFTRLATYGAVEAGLAEGVAAARGRLAEERRHNDVARAHVLVVRDAAAVVDHARQ